MTLTRHGHRIKGTTIDDEPKHKALINPKKCGGPGDCMECTQDELSVFGRAPKRKW